MRRPNWIVSGVLLLTLLGGSAMAAEEKCAAEKKAMEDARTNVSKATKGWMAEVDKMADAYGKLAAAIKKANDINASKLKPAYNAAVAAWLTFTLCRQNSRDPVARCEKQYQAAKVAEANYQKIKNEWEKAKLDVFAEELTVESAKAGFRAAQKKLKAADAAASEICVQR